MRTAERGWSVTLTGANLSLTHVLAVRAVADLPAYDEGIPEPLTPEAPAMQMPPSRALRKAAAPQWAAWWRIALAQNIAKRREAPVPPQPPLFGLDPMCDADPPKFLTLDPTPELKQIVATTWPMLSTWLEEVTNVDYWSEEDWPSNLIARADALIGRPIADVDVHLEVLPIAGLRRWTPTEHPARHFLHALVTPELTLQPTRLHAWLLDALRRIG